MAHNVESMAYHGETPWHNTNCKAVPGDLTPEQFIDEAGLNWEVRKSENFTRVYENGIAREMPTGGFSLVRESDNTILEQNVGPEWSVVQNADMAGFFHDFVMDNEISINTGGSLQCGRIVWLLGKTKRAFDLKFGKKTDTIENYLLFSNYHKFGFSTDIRNTDIRVVCNNTFSEAHAKGSEHSIKFHHRRKFDIEEAKLILRKTLQEQNTYHEKAQFLAVSPIRNTDPMEYFADLFKSTSTKEPYSRNARLCSSVMETQPGAELGEGTWWQAFNAVTYAVDHRIGTDKEGKRLQSAWYGANRGLKSKALQLAVEYAKA